jgi:tRNA U34 5-carboxymethylaminomethyl modifying enzyme MnmG/GidA
MLSCSKATEYLNLREENALNRKQSLQLKMHLLACKTCKAYETQSETIKKMFGVFKSEAQKENEPLKESIKTNIEKL